MSDKKIILHQQVKLSLVLIACLLVVPVQVAKVNSAPLSKSDLDQARASLARYYAWFNAPWTINDSAYQNIRNTIDHDLVRGQKPTVILQRDKEIAEQQPNNPQAIFAYGYGVYKAATLPNAINGDEAFQEEGKVYDAWEKVHAPHTYNYVRLMFLQQSLSAPTPELIPAGKRLLARNPDDYEVEYGLAVVANVSAKPSDRSQAVAYQQDLARRFPNDPRQYRLLAAIYRITAIRTKSEAEADKSIAAFQQYLALAPEYRPQIEDNIRLMKALQAMWRSG